MWNVRFPGAIVLVGKKKHFLVSLQRLSLRNPGLQKESSCFGGSIRSDVIKPFFGERFSLPPEETNDIYFLLFGIKLQK